MHSLRRNFSTGEISPLLYLRTDLDRQRLACETLYNMVCIPEGPVVRRPGTDLVQETRYAATNFRLISFTFSETQSYIYVMTELQLGFFDKSGAIETSPGNPYTISTSSLNIDPARIKWIQSKDVMFVVQDDIPPFQISRTTATTWAISNITFTNPPSEWTTGNYPSVIGFYEQRLVLGATPNEPQTLWFSKTGDYTDLGTSTPLVDTDGFSITLQSEQHNKIAWLLDSGDLLAGSIGDEWRINAGGNSSFTYATARANSQSTRGSTSTIPAIKAGNATIFVETNRRKISELVFDNNSQKYVTRDITALCGHFFEESPILRWSYQKDPHGIIWCVRDDGKLVGITYKPEHGVIGAHLHETMSHFTKAPKFTDVGCTPNAVTGEDDTWFLVERYGENAIPPYYHTDNNLEKLRPFKYDTISDGFHVDAQMTYSGPAISQTDPDMDISFFGHGYSKYSILADNIYQGVKDLSPITGLEISPAASDIQTGINFFSTIIPIHVPLDLKIGTSLPLKARITKILIHVYKTVALQYGKDKTLALLQEKVFRDADDDDILDLFTGFKYYSFPAGYSLEPQIVIHTDKPFPMSIQAVTEQWEVYD